MKFIETEYEKIPQGAAQLFVPERSLEDKTVDLVQHVVEGVFEQTTELDEGDEINGESIDLLGFAQTRRLFGGCLGVKAALSYAEAGDVYSQAILRKAIQLESDQPIIPVQFEEAKARESATSGRHYVVAMVDPEASIELNREREEFIRAIPCSFSIARCAIQAAWYPRLLIARTEDYKLANSVAEAVNESGVIEETNLNEFMINPILEFRSKVERLRYLGQIAV